MEEITISKERYLQLVKANLELNALESAGVDNWPGYEMVDWDWVEEELKKEENRVDEKAV